MWQLWSCNILEARESGTQEQLIQPDRVRQEVEKKKTKNMV
jgi:hypothetical protein